MSKIYYVLVGGKRIPVDEEVYRALMRPKWAEQRRNRRHAEKGWTFLSLDAFLESGYEPATEEQLVDEFVEDKLLLEMLDSALHELTEDERTLIDALYYQEKSERQVARELRVPQSTLIYRRNKILTKLRNYFEKS